MNTPQGLHFTVPAQPDVFATRTDGIALRVSRAVAADVRAALRRFMTTEPGPVAGCLQQVTPRALPCGARFGHVVSGRSETAAERNHPFAGAAFLRVSDKDLHTILSGR